MGEARADRLVDARTVARGDFLSPRFAPDGRELLVTGPQLRGLVLIAPDGATRQLTDEAGAGVHARWSGDAIEYRALRGGARRDLVVDRNGSVRTRPAQAAVAFTHDDRAYARDKANQLVRVGSGDRFFRATISPDGDKVAFEGLATGIHIYTRSTGAFVRIGSGTAPTWSPDSARVVFEQTEDDGHEVVASELYSYTVATRRLQQLTATEGVIERRPSFAPDGARIAFDDNTGNVLVGRIEVTP
jgi:dipeptidyl aminopeptidase/acylaminoacyl peptidase